MAKRRKALQHLRLRGLSPVAEGGTKADLTTGMTTDRKNFDFPSRRDIMAEIEYLGSRDRAFESPHSDQNPSEINDFRGIFLILCLLRRRR